MVGFRQIQGVLHCEQIPLPQLAEDFGTPLYVYSKAQLVENAETLIKAFEKYPTLACFAVKANSNLEILRVLGTLGMGTDIVSIGELERSLLAGISPDKIIYSSIGKRDDEIRRAIEVGILSFNVESYLELVQISQIASTMGKVAPISLRINPNIDAKTHPYIATGLYTTKFGIAESELKEILKKIKDLSSLKLVGLSTHIGSQITSTRPFIDAAKRMATLALNTKALGFNLKYLDMGGGYAISYNKEKIPSLNRFAEGIIKQVKCTGLDLIVEPGRSVVGNAGILLTRVLTIKKTPKKTFIVVDAAMNDLIRPALYSAFHPIEPVQRTSRKQMKVDVVGPICETGDRFATGRLLPEAKVGDLISIGCAGAYGFSMASNYNTRLKASEILVDGNIPKTVRKRESLSDLLRAEQP